MRNNAAITRGRPFQPGNPGRLKGARNKATLAAEALLDGEGEALTRKAVELALAGDTVALRLCLERILPPRKDRPVAFELPAIDTAADTARAAAALARAVAEGEVTPGEAVEIAKVIDIYVRALTAHEFEARLAALEQRTEQPV
jgi:hypothetical protein